MSADPTRGSGGREAETPRPSDPPVGRGDLLISAAFVAVIAAFLVPVPTFGPSARVLPLVVGVPAVLLALADLVRVAVQFARARAVGVEPKAQQATGDRDPERTGWRSDSPYAAAAWLVGAGVVTLVFGFLVGTILFMPVFMWLYGRLRPLTILAVSGGMIGVLYLLFIQVLGVSYWRGLIG